MGRFAKAGVFLKMCLRLMFHNKRLFVYPFLSILISLLLIVPFALLLIHYLEIKANAHHVAVVLTACLMVGAFFVNFLIMMVSAGMVRAIADLADGKSFGVFSSIHQAIQGKMWLLFAWSALRTGASELSGNNQGTGASLYGGVLNVAAAAVKFVALPAIVLESRPPKEVAKALFHDYASKKGIANFAGNAVFDLVFRIPFAIFGAIGVLCLQQILKPSVLSQGMAVTFSIVFVTLAVVALLLESVFNRIVQVTLYLYMRRGVIVDKLWSGNDDPKQMTEQLFAHVFTKD